MPPEHLSNLAVLSVDFMYDRTRSAGDAVLTVKSYAGPEAFDTGLPKKYCTEAWAGKLTCTPPLPTRINGLPDPSQMGLSTSGGKASGELA